MNTPVKNEIYQRLLTEEGPIVIISHTSPDGDAVGSSLALWHVLSAKGKQVHVVFPDSFPDYYAWLPSSETIVIADQQPQLAESLIDAAAVQLVVDMNSLKRVLQLEPVLLKANATRIMIDHHIMPDQIFDFMLSDTGVSSTSELVYSLLQETDKASITHNVACCLYTGIVTDTGNFFHGNLTSHTFEITADIIRKGVDVVRINQLVYNTFSEGRLRLLGFSISERLQVLYQHKASFIALTKADLERFGYQEGDTEDIVNYGLSIKGIQISALFYEKPEFVKISLRSEGDINVNQIAKQYFNGGGHRNASGAHFYGPMNDAINLYLKALEEMK